MNTKKSKIIIICHFLLMIIVGLLYVSYTWINSINLFENQALKVAMSAEASFQKKEISKLEAIPEDIEKAEYQQIKNSLIKIVLSNDDMRFAYLYTMKKGKIYFLVDSEPVSSPDYSPPGQEYSEANEFDFKAFKEKEPIITKPSSDRWGTCISVLVPMKDAETGEIIAVFGMDYPVSSWDTLAVHRTIQASIAAIFLILLLITSYIIFNKSRVLKDDKNKLAFLNDKLIEKEELFRAIFEQSPLGITFGNYETNILDSNPMFGKIVGRSKEELQTLHWTKITHPDDIQKDVEYFEKFKSGEIDKYTMVKRYIRPDGSFVWVNMTIAPLKVSQKNHLSNICIVEDISERIQAEKNLEESERSNAMLLSNLPGMAYRCNYDRDWTMLFVSEGCYELTGYRPESLLLNHEISFNECITPEYREYLWEKWSQTLKEKKFFREEYSIKTATGNIKWVLEQAQGVYDENGEVKVIEGLIIDINDRKMREDEIQYLNYHDVLTGLYNRRYFEEEKIHIDREGMYPLSVIIGDINGLKLFNDALGHAEGDKLIVTMAEILMNCCREEDIIARTGGDEFSILLPKTKKEDANKLIRQIIAICEKYKLKIMNEAYHISVSLGCATKTCQEESFNSILKDAEDNMYRYKLLQSKSLHSSIISSMKSTLFEKSQQTEEHAQRLITLSNTIGQSMGLSEAQLNELELLSTLHDIGKIGISDIILNKPGKLTDEEWIDMRKHPEIGFRIAMSTPELVPIADYILTHHERWDGTGYPQGIKGEKIPLLSRIIAVADAYDAMTADRPYRRAMTKEAAIEEIRNNAGTQFDPKIAELFISIIEKR